MARMFSGVCWIMGKCKQLLLASTDQSRNNPAAAIAIATYFDDELFRIKYKLHCKPLLPEMQIKELVIEDNL